MNVRRRIRMCLLIEKMSGRDDFCVSLGLINKTTFRGKVVCGKERI